MCYPAELARTKAWALPQFPFLCSNIIVQEGPCILCDQVCLAYRQRSHVHSFRLAVLSLSLSSLGTFSRQVHGCSDPLFNQDKIPNNTSLMLIDQSSDARNNMLRFVTHKSAYSASSFVSRYLIRSCGCFLSCYDIRN